MIDVKPHLSALEQALSEALPADCPALIGELERLKAVAWTRMLTPAYGGQPQHPDRAYTIPEVAGILKISTYRAYELARQGKLPATKIGKLVRVSAAQLAQFQGERNGRRAS